MAKALAFTSATNLQLDGLGDGGNEDLLRGYSEKCAFRNGQFKIL